MKVTWSVALSNTTDPTDAAKAANGLKIINNFLKLQTARRVSLTRMTKNMSHNIEYVFSATVENDCKQSTTSTLPLTIQNKNKPVLKVGARAISTYADVTLNLRCKFDVDNLHYTTVKKVSFVALYSRHIGNVKQKAQAWVPLEPNFHNETAQYLSS